MECQFCSNKFSCKTSLKHHQETAKYCLKLQGIKIKKFVCECCKKNFSTKYRLETHYQSCSKYKKKDIEEKFERERNRLLDKISDMEKIIAEKNVCILNLQDKLENIAIRAVERPTSTTNNMKTNINNFIQNMQPVTSENLLEHTENLTLEHVQKGASGYAEYALEYPFKDRIACVDYSRRKIKFKDSEGHLVTDPEMVKLAPMFFNSIKDKSSQLVYSQNDPNMDSVMFERVAKLFNTNADVKNGSSGIKSDFYHDFIKHVCSGSLVD